MKFLDGASSVGSKAPVVQVPLVVASILRPQGTTGVHTHIRELCWYLREQRMAHEVVTPFSWGQALSAPVFGLRRPLQHVAPPASVAWYRYWHTVFLTRALRARLATLGPTVIYAQGPEAARASLDARRGPQQRVVMAVHFLGSQAAGWVSKGHISASGRTANAIERFEREVVAYLDGIVYVSRATRDQFLAAVPHAADVPSSVVPNFVRPLQLPAHPEHLADLVTVGGLEREKNQEFILHVLALARDAGRPYTLDVYGVGPLRPHLERTASKLGLADQVRFCGYDPDVRTALPGYRAYAHACPVETGPLAVIEALAAGLPILAARYGGVPELFSNGIEGRYWPLDDASAASQILIAFLEHDRVRQDASRAAGLRFSSHFDARLVAPLLIRFLNDRLPGTLYNAPESARVSLSRWRFLLRVPSERVDRADRAASL
jgi:glycosyltransferase involved in cell wall biosynthesis